MPATWIAEKAAPASLVFAPCTWQLSLAYLDADLEQFAVNPGQSPGRVGGVHPPNQIPNFVITDGRPDLERQRQNRRNPGGATGRRWLGFANTIASSRRGHNR